MALLIRSSREFGMGVRPRDESYYAPKIAISSKNMDTSTLIGLMEWALGVTFAAIVAVAGWVSSVNLRQQRQSDRLDSHDDQLRSHGVRLDKGDDKFEKMAIQLGKVESGVAYLVEAEKSRNGK
jgi:hypothetical protein